MGKKKLEKIKLIENSSQRKVTLCKRKKGLLKKAIELSVLCDLDMMILMFDKSQQRVVHYGSDVKFNFRDLFENKYHREFFTNRDYINMGGRPEEYEGSVVDDDECLS